MVTKSVFFCVALILWIYRAHGFDPSTCDCARSEEYDPVCGTDGVTYHCPCMFRCRKVYNDFEKTTGFTWWHKGECTAEEQKGNPAYATYTKTCVELLDPEQCTPNIFDPTTCDCSFAPNDPICAADDTTVKNECEFKCRYEFNNYYNIKGFEWKHKGECTK